MPGILSEYKGRANTNICNYILDSVNEVQYLPTSQRGGTGIFADKLEFDSPIPIGSTCIVNNEGNGVKVFMLFTNGWTEI